MDVTMITADNAERIARRAHAGQTDKAGVDYIAHPAAVAKEVADIGTDEEIVAVAWLHDVIEDTDVTFDELASAGATARQIAALDALTHRAGEPRDTYYARVAANADAVVVKIADINHNTSSDRLATLDEATQVRLTAKYAKARTAIGA